MNPIQLKKIQLKEQHLLPPNLHDIRNGLVLGYDFSEGRNDRLVFDGEDDRATFSNVGIFDGMENFEIEFEIDLVTVPTSTSRVLEFRGERTLLITFGDSTADNVLSVRLNQVRWFNPVQTGALTAGVYKFRIEYNASTGWKLYQNDVLIDSDNTTGAIDTYVGTNSIGAHSDGGDALNIGLYDLVISQDSVKQLHYDGSLNEDGTLKDISGNGNHGTITGAKHHDTAIDQSQNGNHGDIVGPTRGQGLGDGRALVFDGADDYVEADVLPEISKSKSFTFVILYKRTGGIRLVNHSNTSDDRFGVSIEGNTIKVGIYDGSSYFVKKSGQALDNQWNLSVTTFDGDSTLHSFINNKELTGSAQPATDASRFLIGRQSSYYLEGNVDLVRIYNRALSAQEIRNLYLYLKKKAGLI